VDEVNSYKRLDLEKDLDEIVRTTMEEKGFILDRFVLRNIAFTPEYADSVEQKQVALQEATMKEHEAEQIRRLAAGEADRIVTIANAEADAILVKAEAEANALRMISQALEGHPDLLTYRYIDKLSPSIRVMLVPNDSPYLLPLPNMETEDGTLALDPIYPEDITLLTPTPTMVPTPTPKPEGESNSGSEP
jgi:regulator of protease activity HflC (stomatin/prohibitin superfamily)